MKTKFLHATHRGHLGMNLGSFVALVAASAMLLLSGCVAPYGYDGYPRYRSNGYGYYGYPRHGYSGGFYSGPYWNGGFRSGFGGHRGFEGGGNRGGRH